MSAAMTCPNRQPLLAICRVSPGKVLAQSHRLGDKSAVWKTTIGELLTPVWWLEFYQGHAYVRISLFGFPDQIAPCHHLWAGGYHGFSLLPTPPR